MEGRQVRVEEVLQSVTGTRVNRERGCIWQEISVKGMTLDDVSGKEGHNRI